MIIIVMINSFVFMTIAAIVVVRLGSIERREEQRTLHVGSRGDTLEVNGSPSLRASKDFDKTKIRDHSSHRFASQLRHSA